MHSFIGSELESYCAKYTKKTNSLLDQLEEETFKDIEDPQMISGHLSGNFLKLLCQMSRVKNVLEIGTFVGYSTLCFAAGLPDDGKIITCDVNEETSKFAQKYFDLSPYAHKIEIKLGPADKTIEDLQTPIDLVFIDADKVNYKRYYDLVLPKLTSGGLILVDNCLWSGEVLAPTTQDALTIHSLNELVSRDERVENVIVPIRDGINLIRKK